VLPVELISWEAAARVLFRWGLELPTEAHWERAARGGTDTRWWTGDVRDGLIGAANIVDVSAVGRAPVWASSRTWLEFDDGYFLESAVDLFRPNPFGLHDVHGNVWEWCLEPDPDLPGPPGDPAAREYSLAPYRGGSFASTETLSRIGARLWMPKHSSDMSIGLRPMRRLPSEG
jgi:formylglycine-generating enzyme required for sulfatase activity